MVNNTAARGPASSLPRNSQFLRPTAWSRNVRSDTLLSIVNRTSLTYPMLLTPQVGERRAGERGPHDRRPMRSLRPPDPGPIPDRHRRPADDRGLAAGPSLPTLRPLFAGPHRLHRIDRARDP